MKEMKGEILFCKFFLYGKVHDLITFNYRFGLDLRNNNFYRGIYYAADGSKIIVFASERVLNFARTQDSINIQSDGTFKTLPKLKDAHQIFILTNCISDADCSNGKKKYLGLRNSF